jgi:hypothetical protein
MQQQWRVPADRSATVQRSQSFATVPGTFSLLPPRWVAASRLPPAPTGVLIVELEYKELEVKVLASSMEYKEQDLDRGHHSLGKQRPWGSAGNTGRCDT